MSAILADVVVVLEERRIRWEDDPMIEKEPLLLLPEEKLLQWKAYPNGKTPLGRKHGVMAGSYSGRQNLDLLLASGAISVC